MSLMQNNSKFIVALDLGNYKVKACLARIYPKVEFIGFGYSKSQGIENGLIINMDLAVRSIADAVSNVERQARIVVDKVVVNISYPNLISRIEERSLDVGQGPITKEQAKSLRNNLIANSNFLKLHVLDLFYTLDGLVGIKSPIGMVGEKLKGLYHTIDIEENYIKNILNTLKTCHLEVVGIVAAPLAMSLGIENKENESNYVLIDLGYSGTWVSIVRENLLLDFFYVPLGGYHITKDISIVMDINFRDAERLKIIKGSVWEFKREFVEFNTEKGSIEIDIYQLGMIIKARVEEIFDLIKRKIMRLQLGNFKVVMMGGSSEIDGINFLAKNFFANNSVKIDSQDNRNIFINNIGMVNYFFNETKENYKPSWLDWFSQIFRRKS